MNRQYIKLKFIATALSLAAVTSITSPAYALTSHINYGQIPAEELHRIPEKPEKLWKSRAITSELENLVSDKVITKDQASKIEAFVKERKEKRKAELDNLKKLSKEERQKYIKEHFVNKPDILEELVSNSIISKEQADVIRTRMEKKSRLRLHEVLSSEVAKGTITQEQSDKIAAFFDKKHEERKAKLANIRTMSESERKAYFQQHPRPKQTIMDELVTEGIITTKQKDALIKAIKKDKNKSRED